MKTKTIMSNILYGGVKVENSVPQELKNAVLSSPAVKRFGLFYKGEITSSLFQKEGGSNSKVETGLLIHKIRPRNILVRTFDLVTGRRRNDGFFYNSREETQSGLIKHLSEIKKNTFVRMLARDRD
jgi:hypothetical protein